MKNLRERCQKLVLDLQTSEWLNTVPMYDRVQMIESFALQIRSEALEEAADRIRELFASESITRTAAFNAVLSVKDATALAAVAKEE